MKTNVMQDPINATRFVFLTKEIIGVNAERDIFGASSMKLVMVRTLKTLLFTAGHLKDLGH